MTSYKAGPVQFLKPTMKEAVLNIAISARYRLLLGDAGTEHNRFDVGHVLIRLFVMEIDQGGTNHLHHRLNTEEITSFLSGRGDIANAGGTDKEMMFPVPPNRKHIHEKREVQQSHQSEYRSQQEDTQSGSKNSASKLPVEVSLFR